MYKTIEIPEFSEMHFPFILQTTEITTSDGIMSRQSWYIMGILVIGTVLIWQASRRREKKTIEVSPKRSGMSVEEFLARYKRPGE